MFNLKMVISNKTRKLIWGKSGNRCAMCKHVLCADATSEDNESTIGDECHIISEKKGGPRYDPNYPKNKIDSFENLILLCRVHHKQVDDQYKTYTTKVLKDIKEDHEKWVSTQLDKNPQVSLKWRIKRITQNIPEYLKKITSGKEVFNIVEGADTFQFDNDELLNKEEIELVGEFLDIAKNWGDLGPDLDPSSRVEIEFRLTNLIKVLDNEGFWIFGAREKQKLEVNGKNTDWFMAIIRVIRKSNSQTIRKDVIDN